MADGKSPHHLIDLDPGVVAYFGVGHEDHKSLHPGNAVAFASNVLNMDIILSPNLYWGWCAQRGPICIITCQLHHQSY